MNILVIAPHPDDEILGCGGIMAKRSKNGDNVYVCIVTKGYQPYYKDEEISRTRLEDASANELLGTKKIFYLDVPTMEFRSVNKNQLSERLLEVINLVKADEVYIPFHKDMHEEHRIISECSMVALRPKYKNVKRIYEYETMSETGWNYTSNEFQFSPNVYENIDDTLEDKLDALRIIKSQVGEYPNARSVESIKYLAKYRGAIIEEKSAEAFILVREMK